MQKISVAILNDIIRYLDNDLIEFYTDNYQKNKYLKESLFDYVSYYVQTDILDKDPEGLSKLLTLKMRARTRRKTRYLHAYGNIQIILKSFLHEIKYTHILH